MMKSMRTLLVVAVTAFLLHLVWEYAQCGYFFDMEDSFQHQVLMITATLGDMNMAVALFLMLGWKHKDYHWLSKGMDRGDWLVTLFYSISMSFYFETRALLEGRWVYSEAMPLIPGTPVGLLPVIQLGILFPLGFYLAAALLRILDRKQQRR